MSKFKVGDKVRVKYIPSVYGEHEYSLMVESYPEFDEVRTIKALSYEGYYLDEPSGFWFSEGSLELVEVATSTTHRTLLGLETEYKVLHDRAAEILHQMNVIGLEIQKLRELGE